MRNITGKRDCTKFYIAFIFLMNFSAVANGSMLRIHASSLSSIASISALFLALIYSMSLKYKRSVLWLFGICLFVNAMMYLVSGKSLFFRMILFALMLQSVDEDDVLFYNGCSILAGLVLVILCIAAGIIPDIVRFMPGKGYGHQLGFGNPNSWPPLVMACMISFNLSMGGGREDFPFSLLIPEIIVTLLAYYLSLTRTLFISMALYFMGLVTARLAGRTKIFAGIMRPLQYMFIVLGSLSYFMAVYYDSNQFFSALGAVLSGRPYLWHKYLTIFPVSINGMRFEENTNRLYGPMDSTYIGLILQGLLMFSVYVFIFTYLSRYAYRKARWGLLASVLAYEAYFFTEMSYDISQCPVLLVFLSVFIKSFREKETAQPSGRILKT